MIQGEFWTELQNYPRQLPQVKTKLGRFSKWWLTPRWWVLRKTCLGATMAIRQPAPHNRHQRHKHRPHHKRQHRHSRQKHKHHLHTVGSLIRTRQPSHGEEHPRHSLHHKQPHHRELKGHNTDNLHNKQTMRKGAVFPHGKRMRAPHNRKTIKTTKGTPSPAPASAQNSFLLPSTPSPRRK